MMPSDDEIRTFIKSDAVLDFEQREMALDAARKSAFVAELDQRNAAAFGPADMETAHAAGYLGEPGVCNVGHPYYNVNGFEVMEIIEAFGLGFRLGCAVKYLLRADRKGSRLGDLKKALWYIQREINLAE